MPTQVDSVAEIFGFAIRGLGSRNRADDAGLNVTARRVPVTMFKFHLWKSFFGANSAIICLEPQVFFFSKNAFPSCNYC